MSAHNSSLELVLTFNNSSKAKRELIQKIISQEYGENIHLTVLFQKSINLMIYINYLLQFLYQY